MALRGEHLYGHFDKVQTAIDRIRQFCPPEGYYVAYSGGKDSTVILELVKMSGVPFDAHYNLTTADPPEVVRFVKTHPEVQIEKPRLIPAHYGFPSGKRWDMWRLIEVNGFPPLRHVRFCCKELKEHGGGGRFVVTGIRAEESPRRRKSWQIVDTCYKQNKRTLNPIFDWTEADVWAFIRERGLPYCSLYDEGFSRVGCVLCPMIGPESKQEQIERWPKLGEAFRRACQRAYDRRIAQGKTYKGFKSGDEMFDWWLTGAGALAEDPDQLPFEFESDEEQKFFYE